MSDKRQAAERICRTLREAGHEALLAGGCVRDLLLGVEPYDYDVATSATPEEIAALFARTIPVGAAFGVQLVRLDEGEFEVATFRSDGPYLDGRRPSTVRFTGVREDALRRDFTINAMYLAPGGGTILDYVGGREDLENGLVRTVGNPEQRFMEDTLRLLRAVRFAARLDFEIEEQTFQAIRRHAAGVQRASAERIRDELLKMLTEGRARRAFELLDATGLLERVLPEVAAMKGVEQPPRFHPEGDVFTHTMLLLERLDNPNASLAVAALLHDVGKPPTQTFEDRIRFNNHDAVGEEMAGTICQRLRIPNKIAERVRWLVRNHMRLSHIADMRESKRKRFLAEEGFPELLELGRLDTLASHGRLRDIHWVEAYAASLPPESVKPEPLLTGTDLIAMGYRPGPLFGEILAAVEDAQLEGELETTEDARRWVAERWPREAGSG
jgi:poly(A) polymerase